MRPLLIDLDKSRETLVTEPSGMTDRIEVSQAIERSALSRLPRIPGENVYIVERDEDGIPAEVTGYIYLSSVEEHAVIVSAYIAGLDDIVNTVEYHIKETREGYDTHLAVFPMADCYSTYEAALAALEAE